MTRPYVHATLSTAGPMRLIHGLEVLAESPVLFHELGIVPNVVLAVGIQHYAGRNYLAQGPKHRGACRFGRLGAGKVYNFVFEIVTGLQGKRGLDKVEGGFQSLLGGEVVGGETKVGADLIGAQRPAMLTLDVSRGARATYYVPVR